MDIGLLLVVIVMLLVSVIGNVGAICLLGAFDVVAIANVISILVDIFIVYYAVKGYKKPHGNMLRYCFFVVGLSFLINCAIVSYSIYGSCLLALSGGIVCYVSGRLDRFDKNKTLLIVVVILLFAFSVIEAVLINPLLFDLRGTIMATSMLTFILQIFALFIVYATRFNEHKEAGLLDDTNK